MDRVPDLSGASPGLALEMAGLSEGGPVEFGANPAAPGKEAVAAEASSPAGERARTAADGRVVLAGGGTEGALRESRSVAELGSSLGRELPFERYRLRGEGGSVVVEGKLNPWVRVLNGRISEVREGDMMASPGPGWSWVVPEANPQVGQPPPASRPDFSALPPPRGSGLDEVLPQAPSLLPAPSLPPVPSFGPPPPSLFPAPSFGPPPPVPASEPMEEQVPSLSWDSPSILASIPSGPPAPVSGPSVPVSPPASPVVASPVSSRQRRRRGSAPMPPPRERHPRAVKAEVEPAAAAPPSRGYKPRRTPGDLYPEQAALTGSMKNYKRKSMSDRHTAQTIDRDAEDRDRAPAASIMSLDQSAPRPRGLRALSLSRNHNIADSSVARLTTEAHASASTPASQASVARFLTSLSGEGSDSAQESVEAFQASQQLRDQGQASRATSSLRQAIDEASVGPQNVRFDDAGVNEEALHGADFELSHGRISERAEAIRDATLDLPRTGAVSYESAFNAVQPTIRTRTDSSGVRRGEYVSSSVSSARTPSGRRWGDMQDEETFRPRRPSHPERRGSSEPRELPSDVSRKTPKGDDEDPDL